MPIPDDASLLAFPMHGQHKLIEEGYRTRDGHLIEWFGRKLSAHGPVAVISRPEPVLLELLRRTDYGRAKKNTTPVVSRARRLPALSDRRRWWVDSLQTYPRSLPTAQTPAVVWNPLVALSNAASQLLARERQVAFDLLDDWTVHFAFQSIRREVERAYGVMFDRANSVTANAEGTLELAHRFGRTDCVLLPNGCDPERFDQTSRATGPGTVGYVGKIGKRIDLDAILETATALPEIRFIFAGPILDREYHAPLRRAQNIELRGDVHYDDVPSLLSEFDIGWVPHRVGAGEVGGDVIKTYEYRAAALPVLTTPIAGVDRRGLSGVTVLPAIEHADWLREAFRSEKRIARLPGPIPADARWESKADRILSSIKNP